MNHYRGKEEIIKSILEALPDGKTRIHQKAEIGWESFNHYLDELLSLGLIEFEKNSLHHNGQYRITGLGQQYLDTVNQLLTLQQ